MLLEKILIQYVLKNHYKKFVHIFEFSAKNIHLLLNILKKDYYDIFIYFNHKNSCKLEFSNINLILNELREKQG